MSDSIAIQDAEVKRFRPPESGAPFNAVEDIIYRRRSVRSYLKKQVPEYLVQRILETGRFAPSSGNVQTWKFIVVQDQKIIKNMEDIIVKLFKRIMKFTDYTKSGSKRKEWFAKVLMRVMPNSFHPVPFWGIKTIANGKMGIWHGAPTVILILADMRAPGHPPVDIGIAGQNMVLAAHSFGLGTCWVSFCTTPLNMDRKWKKRMGIKYPYKLVTSIALGYPRGIPDGYIPRETHAADWYSEDGSFKIIY
ncbi:MAG TPA: nitroreductase family protein [bacterium]